MTDVSVSASSAPPKAASASPALAPGAPTTRTGERRRYDRSILEGPLRPAVWKIAWPTMLTNIIGGMQGIVDHVLVGHLVGYKGNAAIGVYTFGSQTITAGTFTLTMPANASSTALIQLA